MTNIELKNLIKESQGILFKLRLEKSQNKLKNLKAIFLERKNKLAQQIMKEIEC